MKISVALTGYKEPASIKKTINSLLDRDYSGFEGEIELIQITPDKETLDAGKEAYEKYVSDRKLKFLQIKDPAEGKPTALNMAFDKISGEITVFTDGDVYFERQALRLLVEKFENDEKIGIVTGRPVSIDSRNSRMGYYGHLFSDANHYRRSVDLGKMHLERSDIFVKRHKFFPASGYIMAVRSKLLNFELPKDVLVDDAYISYIIYNQGYKIAYEPEAQCFIKYPKTLVDYFRQKKRSTGGYVQLWKYSIVKEETKSRSPWHEIELFWFPFKYASNLKEFMWSIMLLPVRAWLWLQILWDQKIRHKNFDQIWTRVETTK